MGRTPHGTAKVQHHSAPFVGRKKSGCIHKLCLVETVYFGSRLCCLLPLPKETAGGGCKKTMPGCNPWGVLQQKFFATLAGDFFWNE
jgi:hypothetical protein